MTLRHRLLKVTFYHTIINLNTAGKGVYKVSKNARQTTSEKLRACRTNCGLSQKQVADALGVDRTTYTYYECGREPHLSTLVKLAQIFCVDIAALLPQENGAATLRDSEQNVTNPIYSLTKDEQNLLILFRLLNDADKTSILDKITNMTKGNN